MKLCKRCNMLKDDADFYKNKTKNDGLQTSCKLCRKDQDSSHYASSIKRRSDVRRRNEEARKRKRNFVRRYKSFCGCLVCGEKDYIVLELHHTDTKEKEGNPATFYVRSMKRLKDEIRKCVVLCANCHRRVHAGVIAL